MRIIESLMFSEQHPTHAAVSSIGALPLCGAPLPDRHHSLPGVQSDVTCPECLLELIVPGALAAMLKAERAHLRQLEQLAQDSRARIAQLERLGGGK